VSDAVLKDVLHVDAEKVARHFQACEVGAMQIGMVGQNANCANVIAGIFTATGQDIASVHESSLGILKLLPERGGVSLSLLLPSLVIGTVGGGTRLPTQQECLQMMGCAGQGQLYKFAEIIAASCLALDLSTMCAILSNEFVSAHEKLGRTRKSSRITRGELDKNFLGTVAERKRESGAEVRAAVEVPLASNSGIVNGLVSQRVAGVFGLIRYDVELARGEALEKAPAVLKLKSPHEELSRLAAGIISLTGDDQLPGLFNQNFPVFGFGRSDLREVEFYRHAPDRIRRFLPEVWGTRVDPEREVFAVLMEDLGHCSHLDTVDQPEAWTNQSVGIVLRDLAQLASSTMGGGPQLCPGLIEPKKPADFARAGPLFEAMLEYQQKRSPKVFTGPWITALESFVGSIETRMKSLGRARLALSHNDFNTRNLALRPTPEGHRLVVYDWELACVQSPVHDAMEFLIYALPRQADAGALLGWLDHFRDQHDRLGQPLLDDPSQSRWVSLVHDTAAELLLNRLNLYWLLNNVKHFSFLERITWNLKLIVEATRHVAT
jgi:thiamine kinase-like enzyme